MTPAELLAAARVVLHEPSTVASAGWPRTVALLSRQALESAVTEFWRSSPATAQMWRCSRKAQFACLPFFLMASTAREAEYVWVALSEACHYHAYELAPTAGELSGWLDAVARLIESMRIEAPGSRVALHPR